MDWFLGKWLFQTIFFDFNIYSIFINSSNSYQWYFHINIQKQLNNYNFSISCFKIISFLLINKIYYYSLYLFLLNNLKFCYYYFICWKKYHIWSLKYLTATLIHKAKTLSGKTTNLHLIPKKRLSPFDKRISLHFAWSFSCSIIWWMSKVVKWIGNALNEWFRGM